MALKIELKDQGNYLFKHRSYLPVVIILIGLSTFIYTKLYKEMPEWIEYYDLLCVIIGFLGLFIRCVAVGFSGDHTSGRNTSSGQIADEINSTGIYSICRHPLYLGNYFMWLGIAMFTFDLWFIVAFTFIYWVYYERIMFAEESYLIEKYKSAYTDWSAKTPAFIPAFSKWKKPTHSFSWVKIIRQEKTGILNLFLMIFIFKTLGEYLLGEEVLNYTSYWFIGLGIGIVWYLVIKLIQKNTSLLKKDR